MPKTQQPKLQDQLKTLSNLIQIIQKDYRKTKRIVEKANRLMAEIITGKAKY